MTTLTDDTATTPDAEAAPDAAATPDAEARSDAAASPDAEAKSDAEAKPATPALLDTVLKGPDEAADDEPPHALEPRAIRARRRPRAVLLLWAWELAGAFVIATPVYAWARRVWGTHPDGDAVLFEPGGHALLSWLAGGDSALAIVTSTSFVAFATFRLLGVIVTGTVVAMLATGRGERDLPVRASAALRTGIEAFFPLGGVGAVASIVQAVVVGIGFFASSSVEAWATPRFGDARAFTARVVALVLFLAVAAITGIVADLARVAVARDIAIGSRSKSTLRHIADGIGTGIRAARACLGRATLAWSWRSAASLALLWIGAAASDLVGARGGAVLFALFLFHQLVLLVRAGLRVSWLANALRLVLRTER